MKLSHWDTGQKEVRKRSFGRAKRDANGMNGTTNGTEKDTKKGTKKDTKKGTTNGAITKKYPAEPKGRLRRVFPLK